MQTIVSNLSNISIGYAFCGSFCTLSRSLEQMKKLVSLGCRVTPIFSEKVASTDTRFWKAAEFCHAAEEAARTPAIRTVTEAEPIGPQEWFDLLVLAPCSGNTLAKIAGGITDSTVPMAFKSHLRSDRPVLIALASNDALSQSLQNLAKLLTRKSVWFLPMKQDSPEKKPYSLVADYERMQEGVLAALDGVQLMPLFS